MGPTFNMSSTTKKWRWQIAQRAEIRWWQNYLRQRPVGEYLNWKRAYWREFLQRCALAPPPGARILDAGCGPAGIFLHFPQHEVIACDPLLDQYTHKLDHFEPANYPGVRFLPCALEDLSLTKPCDYVFCLNAINHVAQLDRCLDRLVAATHREGYLILSIDAHNYWGLKYLFRTLPGDILHPHQYDLAEYQAMLTRRGLRIERSVCYRRERIFDYHVLIARKA